MSADGPEVSRLVFGCWRILDDERGGGAEVVLEKIDACLAEGITTFDHADIYGGYGCEEAFGAAVRSRPGLADQIEVVTKCGIALVTGARPENRLKHYDSSAGHIERSVERSLKNLGVEAIDVLLLHRPDPLMDADETAGALEKLIMAGKVKHAGVSNFSTDQFELLQSRLDKPLVTNQIEMSVLETGGFEDGTLDQCQRMGVRPMAWSPMGGGRLFGGDDARGARVRERLVAIGEGLGAGVDQLAFAWLMKHPAGALPIIGTNRLDRIKAAAGSEAFVERLDRQSWFEILEASAGCAVP